MAISDPIADMLTRIRNGVMARHRTINIPSSRMKIAISEILKREGFINDFAILDDIDDRKIISLDIAYSESKEPVIMGLRRVSKPGLRVYVQKGEIPRVFGGLGISMLSTSKGLMTGKEAKREGVGGELLCHVW
jgi:small subunit ribosomal protein S8|tara:strand:- start:576 stop:977 length:402 start_codon:yes stop_codon:yes gene_type:complete